MEALPYELRWTQTGTSRDHPTPVENSGQFLQTDRKVKTHLDMDGIARGLGADRRGKVTASGGHFGASQLLADIEDRFRVPLLEGTTERLSEDDAEKLVRPRRRAGRSVTVRR